MRVSAVPARKRKKKTAEERQLAARDFNGRATWRRPPQSECQRVRCNQLTTPSINALDLYPFCA